MDPKRCRNPTSGRVEARRLYMLEINPGLPIASWVWRLAMRSFVPISYEYGSVVTLGGCIDAARQPIQMSRACARPNRWWRKRGNYVTRFSCSRMSCFGMPTIPRSFRSIFGSIGSANCLGLAHHNVVVPCCDDPSTFVDLDPWHLSEMAR